MSESMGQWPRKIKEKTAGILIEKMAQEAVQLLREGGWRKLRENLVARHLKKLGIVPQFMQEDEPGFTETRRRLNTEPGVIICNHPNVGEVPIILSSLNREDLKVIVAQEQVYKHLPADIAQKYFFSADPDPLKIGSVFRGIKKHIKSGGVLLIFPQPSRSAHFERGLRVMLQGILKPEDMVYCFNVNTSDAAKFPRIISGAGVGSDLFSHSVVNINNLRGPTTIRTAEKYTQAREWQSAIAGVPEDEADIALTQKYEGMFASNK